MRLMVFIGGQAVTHRLGDFVGCLVPDFDQFLATLVVVDQALVVLAWILAAMFS